MVSLWKITFYVVLPSIAVFFLVLLFYNFQSYLEQSTSIIYYPYKIFVTPKITEHGQLTTIAVSTGDSKNNNNNGSLSLVVIYPDSHQLILYKDLSVLPLLEYTLRINFPYKGNYSILVVNNVNDKLLASSTFEIKSLATIVGSYLFGQGIGFLFAALGPIITIFLERVSKMHDERTKILESKSQYMIEHMKEHGNLEVRSQIILSLFQNGHNNKTFNNSYNVDSAKLLTSLLRYWLAYHIFLRKVAGFYFDNYSAELLAFRLSRDIRIQITDKIFYGLNFQNYAELRKEHEEGDTVKTIDEDEDNIYKMALSDWLANNREDVKIFYKNLLLFHSIIHLGLNTALTVTYSNRAKLMKDLKADVKSEPEINEYLRSIPGHDSADLFDLFPQFSKWNRFS